MTLIAVLAEYGRRTKCSKALCEQCELLEKQDNLGTFSVVTEAKGTKGLSFINKELNFDCLVFLNLIEKVKILGYVLDLVPHYCLSKIIKS
jgi:hypothetical protein